MAKTFSHTLGPSCLRWLFPLLHRRLLCFLVTVCQLMALISEQKNPIQKVISYTYIS